MLLTTDLRRSLTAKVLLGLCLLGCVFGAVYIGARLASLPRVVAEREGVRARRLAEPMRFALEGLAERHPEVTEQTLQLQRLLERLARTGGVRAAAVLDASGRRFLASTGEDAPLHDSGLDLPLRAQRQGQILVEQEPDGRNLVLAVPVRRPAVGASPAEPFGVLLIRYDLTAPLAERQAQSLRDLGVLALGLAVMMGIVLLGLREMILKPLSALDRQAARLGGGDLSARSGVSLPAAGGDEIGRLAASFDGMAARLQAAAEDQARLNDELRASEAHGRAVFEHASIAISTGDPLGRILDANPAFLKLWGYTLEELKGVRWIDLTHPDDRAESLRQSGRLLAGEIDGFALEKRYVRADGQIVWASVNVDSMRNGAGQVEMLVLAAEDISPRKAAELARAEREETFQAMFENNTAMQLLVDPETAVILDANHAAAAFYGYTREEMRGPVSRLNPLPEERIRAIMAEARANGGVFRVPHRLKSGEQRQMELAIGPFRLGRRFMLHTTLRDITESLRAESALRETEERLRLLIESMDEGVVISTDEGRLRYVNPAFARMLGMEPGEIEGREYRELLTPESAAGQPARHAARRRGSRQPYEARFLRRDGGEVLGGVTPFPMFSAQGDYQGSCALIRDITRARANEQAEALRRKRRTALLRLHGMSQATRKELLDFSLETLLELTGSAVGYICDYDDTRRQFTLLTWSRGVMDLCAIDNKQQLYDLDATGVWGDAVRLREPVLLNDFAAPHPGKKGFPEGHVPLSRFLTVPVLRAGRVVAVVGVANKAAPYDEEDIVQIRLFTDGLWTVLERHLALAELHAVTERFHLAARAAHIGLWDWDLATGAMHCDPFMEKTFGISGQNLTGTAEDWLCRVHPEDRQRVRAALETTQAGGSRLEARFRVLRPDGGLAHIDTMAVGFRGPADEPLRMIGVIRDVTGQRLAEEQAEESHRFLQNVIDTLPTPFACKDAEGRYLLVNQAFVNVHGLKPEQALGRTMDAFAPPEVAVPNMAVDARLLADPSLSPVEYEVAHADQGGHMRHWLVVKSHLPLSGGRAAGLAALTLDITGRKHAEDALREERRRLSDVIEGTAVGTWEWNVQTGAVVYNERWAQICGYTLEELAPTDINTWSRLAHPEDLERSNELLARHFRGEAEYYDCECRMRHKDGGWIWVQDRGRVASLDAAGRPLLMSGTHADITQRKLAEVAIRESEKRFRDLATMLRLMCDNAKDMIWAKDREKRYLFANKAMCENLLQAADTDEPLGKTDLYFAQRERDAHPDDPAWHTFGEICQDSDDVILETGRPAQFDEYGNVRGRFMYFDVRKAPLLDEQGALLGTVGTGRDITERKRADDLLRQSEERFRDLFMDAPVPYQSLDIDGRLLLANQAWLETLGYTREEALGKSFADFLRPDQIPLTAELFPRFKESGVLNNAEFVMRRKNGTTLLASFNGRVSRDEQGRFIRTHCTFQDITERRRAEDELRRAKAAAEAATLAKAQFLANMSHEIRTPLGGVLGAAKLLSLAALPQEQRQLAEMAVESGRALLAIVNDILDFSKIEAGRLELRPAPFDLRAGLEAVAAPFRLLATQRGLALNLVVDLNVPRAVVADQGRLDQVLRNLLGNAVKFTEAGTITLSVASDPACPKPEGRVCLRFTVSDTGVGIAPDFLPFLFDSFSQADDSYSKRHGGTGLGLAISRSLVERMGGTLTVTSEPGRGSDFGFTLCLPLAPKAEPAARPEAERPAQPGTRPLRILLAEDGAIVRTLLLRILEEAGHGVLAVDDGRKALAVLAAEPFDLVLMDVQMPEVDGLSATRSIRRGEAGERNREIPVVALTAYVQRADRERFLAAGMDDFVPKPVEEHELLAAIRRVTADRPAAADARPTKPGGAARRTRPPELAPRFDRAYLARSFADRPDLLAELLDQFRDTSLPEALRTLREALASGDVPRLRLFAHKAKGTLGTVGARRATLLAHSLELAASGGDAAACRQRAEALFAEAEALAEHLAQGRPWPSAEDETP